MQFPSRALGTLAAFPAPAASLASPGFPPGLWMWPRLRSQPVPLSRTGSTAWSRPSRGLLLATSAGIWLEKVEEEGVRTAGHGQPAQPSWQSSRAEPVCAPHPVLPSPAAPRCHSAARL